ncbi:MAG: hypothetical protein KAT79_05600, partial [candidate division Zixibacteria bacterium]|nr:hypothetical protein [candidate division Zixibacteria bacterium]
MERYYLSLERREKLGLALLLVAMLLLFLGLVKLQVFDHAKLAAQSESNRIRVVPIVPSRGVVLDREGRVIIDSRPSYSVSVIPAEEVAEVTVSRLAELIGVDTLQIRKRIRKNTVSRYQPAIVKRDISFEVVAVLEEQSARYPGIAYQVERVRKYTDQIA